MFARAARLLPIGGIGVGGMAVILLLASFFYPWYQVQYIDSPTSTESYGLTSDSVPANYPGPGEYVETVSSLNAFGWAATAQLYTQAEWLVGIGAVVGLAAIGLSVLNGRRLLHWIPVAAFGCAALVAFSAPFALAVDQPGDLCHDLGASGGVGWPGPLTSSPPTVAPGCGWAWRDGGGVFSGPTPYGPQSSFEGAHNCTCTVETSPNSFGSENDTNRWGPTTGWDLAVVAGALFTAAGLFLAVSRSPRVKERPDPRPPKSPETPTR